MFKNDFCYNTFSTGFTLDTYAHVTTSAQREAAETMGQVLKIGFADNLKAWNDQRIVPGFVVGFLD